jgi:hypothetical protein
VDVGIGVSVGRGVDVGVKVSVGVGVAVAVGGTGVGVAVAVGGSGVAVGTNGVLLASSEIWVAVAGTGVAVGSADPQPVTRSEPNKISVSVLRQISIVPPPHTMQLSQKLTRSAITRSDCLCTIAVTCLSLKLILFLSALP